ncbi:hypothetical protein [Emticicia sp. C21]|uniref:hypothetical protein n=1 Tax=Emticicia sp. C21 TaxID=2302915 RepID=UPI000E348554|nr:hypothetical protein [Emticicia sp. C21]RFS15404.1 hypothetical protein D0T08_14720 [Emticicia sp. C21]
MQGKLAKIVPAFMLAIMIIITAAVLVAYYTGHQELALVIQKIQFYVIGVGAIISLFLLFKQRQQKKKAE